MKKHVFTFVAAFFICVGSAVSVSLLTAPGESSVIPASLAEESALLDWAVQQNREVSTLLTYGVGPESPYPEDALAAGEGYCGDYANLLFRRLQARGMDARIVDIHSKCMGAIHAVVELSLLSGSMYVFDPTHGIYYPCSLNQLLADPDTWAAQRIGTPTMQSFYLDTDFFRYAYRLHSTQTPSAHELLSPQDPVAYTYSAPAGENGTAPEALFDGMDGTSYEAALSTPIEITFAQTQNLYRLTMTWPAPDACAEALTVEILQQGAWRTLWSEESIPPSAVYDRILSEEEQIDGVRVTVEQMRSGAETAALCAIALYA